MPSGSNIHPVPIAAGQAQTGLGLYYGFTVKESGGTTTATVTIYDNTAGSGTILDVVQLAANQSTGDFYGPQGIRANNGIFVTITGTVVGSLRIG